MDSCLIGVSVRRTRAEDLLSCHFAEVTSVAIYRRECIFDFLIVYLGGEVICCCPQFILCYWHSPGRPGFLRFNAVAIWG